MLPLLQPHQSQRVSDALLPLHPGNLRTQDHTCVELQCLITCHGRNQVVMLQEHTTHTAVVSKPEVNIRYYMS